MLIRNWDAALDDQEWRDFVGVHDFGQFIASGLNRRYPVVVPTHFVFDGKETILLHLARANPIWEPLAENCYAVMSVAGAYAYIPTHVNGGRDEPARYGVPTSHYGAVQLFGRCETLDGDELAPLLEAQLEHFEPEGDHAPVEPGDNPYAKQFAAIRGIRLTVEEVRAKFKFANNKSAQHREQIADYLDSLGDENASEARANLLRRLEKWRPHS